MARSMSRGMSEKPRTGKPKTQVDVSKLRCGGRRAHWGVLFV